MKQNKLCQAVALILSSVSVAASAAPFAYIANSGSNSVAVIDTASDTVSTTVPVGNRPYGVAVARGGARVYVTNYDDNTLSVIDGTTQHVIATVPVGANPIGVAVGNERVVVANRTGQSLTVIDTNTNAVVGTLPLAGNPEAVDFMDMRSCGAGGNFVITLPDNNSVLQLDAHMLQTSMTTTVGTHPRGIATCFPDTYTADSYGDTLSRIHQHMGMPIWWKDLSVPVAGYPMGLALTPGIFPPNQDTRSFELLVAKSLGNSVAIVDRQTMSTVAEIPVGHWPTGLAVTPSGAKAYVANYNDNSVSVIDTHTRQVTATIPVGIRPAAMGHFIQPYGNTWPDAFSFSPVAGVQPSSPTAKAPNWVVSNSVTIQGIDEPVEALISCPGRCALSVDGGAWTEYAPNVAPGQSIRVRLAASTGYFTKTSTTLHVGASESTFSVTTKMKVILPILP